MNRVLTDLLHRRNTGAWAARSLLISFCVTFMATTAGAGGVTLSGRAEAIDGDSLVIKGHEIRLFGADAFEYHQTCGRMKCGEIAADTMRQLVEGKTVTCEKQDTDRYGRTVAICRTKCTASFTCDLGQEMVRRGLAVAYRHYSMKYVPDETAAKRTHAGAWAHGFDAPQTWRKEHPRT